MNNAKEEKIYFLGLNQKILIRSLFAISAFLIFCHVLSLTAFHLSWQWERLFHLDLESNIPTWFSSALLALAAMAAFSCSRWEDNMHYRNIWIVTAVFLLFLSCDEVASLHENISLMFVSDMKLWPLISLPFTVPFFFMLIWKLRGCLRNSSRAAKLLAIGGTLFLTGSIGMELLTIPFVGNTAYQLLMEAEPIFEEFLEMIGSIFTISGLLAHQNFLCTPFQDKFVHRFDKGAELKECQA